MTAQDQQSREAFEAWARRACYEVERHDSGQYASNITEQVWQSWQAARALPAEMEPFAWANVFNDPRRPSFDKLAAPHITEDAADRQIERHEQRRLTPLRKVPLYTTAPRPPAAQEEK